MASLEAYFHQQWLDMLAPHDGLLVAVAALEDVQAMQRQPLELRHRVDAHLSVSAAASAATPGNATANSAGGPSAPGSPRSIRDLRAFLLDILGYSDRYLAPFEALEQHARAALTMHVAEGGQIITPTYVLRESPTAAPTALLWDLPTAALLPADSAALALDKAETITGNWHYPPAAKFDRLLRHTGVPLGILTNRTHIRLIYAPAGESSGSLTFSVAYLAETLGRPLLDGFCILLSARAMFERARGSCTIDVVRASRKYQSQVTNDLADQVFDALGILLNGFEDAATRDGANNYLARADLSATTAASEHVYSGLLTVLLRSVFILYAEDRSLLPVEHPHYAANLSLIGLAAELAEDAGRHGEAMTRRFGAWGRMVALWRALFLGVRHGALHIPPHHGALFSPHEFGFLEGWGAELADVHNHRRDYSQSDANGDTDGDADVVAPSAPINDPLARAAVQLPSISDDVVHNLLDRLLMLKGQRLSYRALDVEQIGSVYERLMGYRVQRLAEPAVCIGAARTWITVGEITELPAAQRVDYLKDDCGVAKKDAEKIAKNIAVAEKTKPAERPKMERTSERSEARQDALVEALALSRAKRTEVLPAGRLVMQPGAERRRTSSHYTPRELTAPIVQHTLQPLLDAIQRNNKGNAPATAEQILRLNICDPAMGSGAFLVESCRFLADQVVTAWQRDNSHPTGIEKNDSEAMIASARRLVAQRCLYGVDKNRFAVNLAKLSLWLITLSRDLPFTFLDHALRAGDSLVGLSRAQIEAFHWKPTNQLETSAAALAGAFEEAVAARQRIAELANVVDQKGSSRTERQQELAFFDAEDALNRIRLLGNLIVGAFFAGSTDKEREAERVRRLAMVNAWLANDQPGVPEELLAMQRELHQGSAPSARGNGKDGVPGLVPFHWMIEFPEVFWHKRPNPLAKDAVDGEAWMDGVVGNPPFMGGSQVSGTFGNPYRDWLLLLHSGSHGNADLSAHFFRRADTLLGQHGACGLVATNTIAQGDTRETALKPLLREGHRIVRAVKSMPWPGEAAVTVAIVQFVKGNIVTGAQVILDEMQVNSINSRLRLGNETPDPTFLNENAQMVFLGVKIYGNGFVLTPSEHNDFVKSFKNNAERIFPYLGGEQINTSPTQDFDRYVINFGDMSLEDAMRWPDLVDVLKKKVKPERDRNNRENYRKFWWRFGELRPGLNAALATRNRCVVTARVTKHLCFSFQPANRVLNEMICVFPAESHAFIAILQSRMHSAWTWLLSSTLEVRLIYSATDCFANFPFPIPPRDIESISAANATLLAAAAATTPAANAAAAIAAARAQIAANPRAALVATLDDIGQRLYDARAAYMIKHQVGLTITYNRLKDPTLFSDHHSSTSAHTATAEVDTAAATAGTEDADDQAVDIDLSAVDQSDLGLPELRTLRALHIELDRTVALAYATAADLANYPATTPRPGSNTTATRSATDVAATWRTLAANIPPLRPQPKPDDPAPEPNTPAAALTTRHALFEDTILDLLFAENLRRAGSQ